MEVPFTPIGTPHYLTRAGQNPVPWLPTMGVYWDQKGLESFESNALQTLYPCAGCFHGGHLQCPVRIHQMHIEPGCYDPAGRGEWQHYEQNKIQLNFRIYIPSDQSHSLAAAASNFVSWTLSILSSRSQAVAKPLWPGSQVWLGLACTWKGPTGKA